MILFKVKWPPTGRFLGHGDWITMGNIPPIQASSPCYFRVTCQTSTLPETNIFAPENRPFNAPIGSRIVFQASILRGENAVSFREGMPSSSISLYIWKGSSRSLPEANGRLVPNMELEDQGIVMENLPKSRVHHLCIMHHQELDGYIDHNQQVDVVKFDSSASGRSWNVENHGITKSFCTEYKSCG